MISLILDGSIGALEIDISRDETISRLGLPSSWLGKPPCIGPHVAEPFSTDVWFYYDDAVGIRFDTEDFVEAVWVLPQQARNGQEPFQDWPALNFCLTLGFLRNYLLNSGIHFAESHDEGVIVSATNCFAYGFPFQEGLPVPFDRRPIEVLEHVRHRELLPEFVHSVI